jgi:hypothetical protein
MADNQDEHAKSKTVPYRESTDGPVIQIPVTELAPGMVLATRTTDQTTAWTPAAEIKPRQDFFHPPLEGAIKNFVTEAYQTLAVAWGDRMDPQRWEDGFRKDLNAWKEIYLNLTMARMLKALTAGRKVSEARQSALLHLLSICTMAGDVESVLASAPQTPLVTRDEVKRIARRWMGNEPHTLVSGEERGIIAEYGRERCNALAATLAPDLRVHLKRPPDFNS